MYSLFPEGNFKKYRKEFNDYYEAYIGKDTRYHKIMILLDVISSYIRYGSWINNYFEYKFWKKSHKVRNEFLTWKKARLFIDTVNGKGHNPLFRSKHLFLEEYKEYIIRDWMYVPESNLQDVEKFLKNHEFVMEKYDEGLFGMGITKVKTSDICNIEEYYEKLRTKNVLLEEHISECRILQELHPESLNTIRVATYYDSENDTVSIVGAVLRIGNNGAIVDNARSNGLFAAIDIETGIVNSPAVDFMGDVSILHPYTHKQILGITIPNWDKVKVVCCDAARKSKITRFVGWDVVIRENTNGEMLVELIEGNDRPGVPTLQVANDKGIYYEVRKLWKH